MNKLSKNQILILGGIFLIFCLILVIGGGYFYLSNSQASMPTIAAFPTPTQFFPTLYVAPTLIQNIASYPTAIPPATSSIATKILLENGFVRDSSYDSRCSSPCESYVYPLYVMIAAIYDNGEFGISFSSDPSVDARTQGRILGLVVTGIYGPDMANWIGNNIGDLNGIRQGQVGNYKVAIQSSVSSDGNTIMDTVVIGPIG